VRSGRCAASPAAPAHHLVGREAELAALAERLSDPGLPARHGGRAGRQRQDPPRPRGGRRPGTRLSGRRLLRPPGRGGPRSPAWRAPWPEGSARAERP
jgi:hypothetical protein